VFFDEAGGLLQVLQFFEKRKGFLYAFFIQAIFLAIHAKKIGCLEIEEKGFDVCVLLDNGFVVAAGNETILVQQTHQSATESQ
jgi:hypothetical protein